MDRNWDKDNIEKTTNYATKLQHCTRVDMDNRNQKTKDRKTYKKDDIKC